MVHPFLGADSGRSWTKNPVAGHCAPQGAFLKACFRVGRDLKVILGRGHEGLFRYRFNQDAKERSIRHRRQCHVMRGDPRQHKDLCRLDV